jgi:phosphatidylglycerophosphatase A
MWRMAATVFGVGRIGIAPGTAASLLALPLAWIAMSVAGPFALLALSLAVGVFGIWASEIYAIERNDADPPDCVIDEIAGQLLACAFAPLSAGGFVFAFVLFRLFDISKLWPVSAAERMKGGFGIMADDMVAGLIAGVIVAVFDSVGLI